MSCQNFADTHWFVSLAFWANFLPTQLHTCLYYESVCSELFMFHVETGNIFFSWEHSEVAVCQATQAGINIYK